MPTNKITSNVWKYLCYSQLKMKKIAVCKTCHGELTYTGGIRNVSNDMKGQDCISKHWK
jgi:hypothetical protein